MNNFSIDFFIEKIKNSKNLRIFLSLFISFFLAGSIINIFQFYSPKVDTEKLKTIIQSNRNSISSFFNKIKENYQIKFYRENKKNLISDKRNFDSDNYIFFPTLTPVPETKRDDNFFNTPTLTPTIFYVTPTTYFNYPTVFPTPSRVLNTPTSTRLPTLQPTSPPPPTPTRVTNRQPAGRLSNSKLGVFYLVNYTPGGEMILNSGPRILKFIDPYANSKFMEEIQKYKRLFPNGILLLRFWQNTSGILYQRTDDPYRSAEDFFNRVMIPNYQVMGNGRFLFDYVQTPNEAENTPQWSTKEDVDWNGKFWRRLAELNNQMGMKTCVGGTLAGTPRPENLELAVDDLVAIYNLGGAFCYHGYSDNYNKDLGYELNWSLLYRQIHNYLKSRDSRLGNMPFILSEGGIAENWDGFNGGFLKNNNVEKYKDWLLWFDSRLREDPYVIGVTLFQIGNNTDWAIFNHEIIAEWLANHLRNN